MRVPILDDIHHAWEGTNGVRRLRERADVRIVIEATTNTKALTSVEPSLQALVERSRRAVGGTIAAARHAVANGIGMNLAGGTHHAFPDSGEGFCVFNDIAVSIRMLQAERSIRRALVVAEFALATGLRQANVKGLEWSQGHAAPHRVGSSRPSESRQRHLRSAQQDRVSGNPAAIRKASSVRVHIQRQASHSSQHQGLEEGFALGWYRGLPMA